MVRVVNVTEECGQQAEYCQLDLRTQAISQETILCQQPGDVVSIAAATQPLATSVQVCEPCLDTEGCGEMRCQRNVIVVCSTVAQVQTSTRVT